MATTFFCAICHIEEDGIVTKELDRCHHSFCETCIDNWFEVKKECPVCKQSYRDSDDEEERERFGFFDHYDEVPALESSTLTEDYYDEMQGRVPYVRRLSGLTEALLQAERNLRQRIERTSEFEIHMLHSGLIEAIRRIENSLRQQIENRMQTNGYAVFTINPITGTDFDTRRPSDFAIVSPAARQEPGRVGVRDWINRVIRFYDETPQPEIVEEETRRQEAIKVMGYKQRDEYTRRRKLQQKTVKRNNDRKIILEAQHRGF